MKRSRIIQTIIDRIITPKLEAANRSLAETADDAVV